MGSKACPFITVIPIVHTSSQALALSTMTNLTGKLFPIHSSLNTCIGTVSVSLIDYPVYNKDWSDRENDLLACFIDYDVAKECYTIFPRGHRKSYANITKINFHGHDFPH